MNYKTVVEYLKSLLFIERDSYWNDDDYLVSTFNYRRGRKVVYLYRKHAPDSDFYYSTSWKKQEFNLMDSRKISFEDFKKLIED